MASRTINPGAWSKTSYDAAVAPGMVNEVVTKCMSELYQQALSTKTVRCQPWPRPHEECSGVMWAGVPAARDYWCDEEGGWIISANELRPEVYHNYMRLCPSPPDAEVQYGFCPLRLNRIREFAEKDFGPDGERLIKIMPISRQKTGSFRIDKMVVAATKLADTHRATPTAKRFQSLLGTTPLSVFIEDMLRGCYQDLVVKHNILYGRDSTYREMVQSVAEMAYGNFLDPTELTEVTRLSVAMEQNGSQRWRPEHVWPYLYNVVMPQVLFDAVSKNMEKGLPPIVPQYVTHYSWMFNGKWSDSCTGLEFPSQMRVTPTGGKVVAGVVNRFNTDIPGGVSFWPGSINPPEAWLGQFIKCVETLGEQELPLDAGERFDLALLHARRIPVMFRVNREDRMVNKFARLMDLEANGNFSVTKVVTRECNETGQEWIGESTNPSEAISGPTSSPSDGSFEDEEQCSCCGELIMVGDSIQCYHCGSSLCTDHYVYCNACGQNHCEGCDAGTDHTCMYCDTCGGNVMYNYWLTCSGCRVNMCNVCCDQACNECGTGGLCAGCASEHGCGEED